MISSVGELIEVMEVKVGGNESVCQIEKILGWTAHASYRRRMLAQCCCLKAPSCLAQPRVLRYDWLVRKFGTLLPKSSGLEPGGVKLSHTTWGNYWVWKPPNRVLSWHNCPELRNCRCREPACILLIGIQPVELKWIRWGQTIYGMTRSTNAVVTCRIQLLLCRSAKFLVQRSLEWRRCRFSGYRGEASLQEPTWILPLWHVGLPDYYSSIPSVLPLSSTPLQLEKLTEQKPQLRRCGWNTATVDEPPGSCYLWKSADSSISALFILPHFVIFTA